MRPITRIKVNRIKETPAITEEAKNIEENIATKSETKAEARGAKRHPRRQQTQSCRREKSRTVYAIVVWHLRILRRPYAQNTMGKSRELHKTAPIQVLHHNTEKQKMS